MFRDGRLLGLRAAATASRASCLRSDPSGPSLRPGPPGPAPGSGPTDAITLLQGPNNERRPLSLLRRGGGIGGIHDAVRVTLPTTSAGTVADVLPFVLPGHPAGHLHRCRW